ncbi:acyl-CoA dehydrogenase family protein [Embleya hyalina]|uniref:Acyl-CoA dehydrogenase FadE27 n=1 Tax=Embleya hyalina TaxID=516124 RepID=A0A401Z0X6_9ACTN|nr:acyl-CoA dehydrogenase family protein [Embleya hyalina]GCE00416.1 acyl-CoA dehydrogenase FadE27 [Embleya hyalina]
MDFGYTEEQQDLVGLAGRILGERVTHEALTALDRRVEQDGAPRLDRELWAELAKANLLGIGLPEEFGGSGYGVFEQCLILEQIGRTLAPVPFGPSIAVAASLLSRMGTDEQKATWLPGAVDGSRILTYALAEPYGRDGAAPATKAVRTDGVWHLDGVKTAVPAATVADLILVSADLGEGHAGVFLVDPKAPGVRIEAQLTTAKEIAGLVTLERAVGTALGGPDAAVNLRELATLALCATQLGVTEKAMRETAKYASERVQFKRPIGSFQAVGHRLADAYIDVEAIRLTTWQAAWRVAESLDPAEAIATAKFWAADGGHRVAHAAVHVHGGMGVAEEHFVHRYFNHAKQLELSLGGATEQALRIGAGFAATPAGEFA